MHIFLLIDGESGNQKSDQTDDSQDRKSDPDRHNSAHGRLQRAPDERSGIADRRSQQERHRDISRNTDAGVLCGSQFRDQRVIRRAVGRHEQIEQEERNQEPDAVYAGDRVHRRPENEDRNQRERNRDLLHERNPSPLRVCGSIRKVCDHRVCYSVEHSAERRNTADHGGDPEDHASLRDEKCLTCGDRIRIRLIEVNKPVCDQS